MCALQQPLAVVLLSQIMRAQVVQQQATLFSFVDQPLVVELHKFTEEAPVHMTFLGGEKFFTLILLLPSWSQSRLERFWLSFQ